MHISGIQLFLTTDHHVQSSLKKNEMSTLLANNKTNSIPSESI